MNRLILISPYKEEALNQFFLVKTAVCSEDFSPHSGVQKSEVRWVHFIFENILVGAKHFGSRSLILTHKLCAEMLRPCQNEIHPVRCWALAL
jgi:hypothetical protein